MIVEWTEISSENPSTLVAMRVDAIHAVFEASGKNRDAGANCVVAYFIQSGKLLTSAAQEHHSTIVERWRLAWRQAPAGFATMGPAQ